MRLDALLLAGFVAATAGVAANASTIAPAWTASIDSRDRAGDEWVATDAQRAYAARAGQVVAIDVRSGRTIWNVHVAPVGHVAVRGNRVFVPVSSGYVVLDAGTGRRIRSRDVGPDVEFVNTAPALVVHQGTALRGWDASGNVMWRRDLPVASSYLQSIGPSQVGLFGFNRLLVLDSATGNAMASVDGVDQLVGADGRYLWFNVSGGGIKGVDLQRNRSVVLHNSIVRDAVRVEHSVAVAVIDGRLSAIDLRNANPVPVRLAVDGRWVGGPVDGKIFVERGDGIYEQSLTAGHAHRIVAYRGASPFITAIGHRAYFGLDDGRIVVADLTESRTLAEISTKCRSFEGVKVVSTGAIAHCDVDSTHAQLVPLVIAQEK